TTSTLPSATTEPPSNHQYGARRAKRCGRWPREVPDGGEALGSAAFDIACFDTYVADCGDVCERSRGDGRRCEHFAPGYARCVVIALRDRFTCAWRSDPGRNGGCMLLTMTDAAKRLADRAGERRPPAQPPMRVTQVTHSSSEELLDAHVS